MQRVAPHMYGETSAKQTEGTTRPRDAAGGEGLFLVKMLLSQSLRHTSCDTSLYTREALVSENNSPINRNL